MSIFLPEPTKYDISFRCLGIPVRISIGFWMVHGAIGAMLGVIVGLGHGILWIVAAFVSILIHEMGHVVVGQAFGSKGEIVLTPLGGLAGGCAELHRRRNRIIVYLAGPLAQLVFAGVLSLMLWLFLLPRLVDESINELAANQGRVAFESHLSSLTGACIFLIAFNVGLAFINLLPIAPLDGGKIMQELTGGTGHGDRAPWEQDPDGWKVR